MDVVALDLEKCLSDLFFGQDYTNDSFLRASSKNFAFNNIARFVDKNSVTCYIVL